MSRSDKNDKISLHDLAQQVREGGHGAAERFLEALRPQMQRMVRQTVRQHVGPDCYGTLTDQGRLILAEYHRFCRQGRAITGLSGDEIVARVADRLCETAVRRLEAEGRALYGTPVCQGALETVCA